MKNGISIGFQLAAQYGDIAPMRAAWVKAEELGADRLYTSDHFHAIEVDADILLGEHEAQAEARNLKVFEATAIQAAMAVTTSRVEIGCNVHANSFRNPNLMAFWAGTVDHLSGGRFLLGMGSGYHKADYEGFGYEYGTQTSRSLDLDRDIAIMLDRFTKLHPPPVHHIPLMIGSMGKKIGLRTVAKYADIWHAVGPYEVIAERAELLRQICKEVGRDVNDIEFAMNYFPDLYKGPNENLDNYLKLGFKHFVIFSQGPDWDLGPLREMLAWRNGA